MLWRNRISIYKDIKLNFNNENYKLPDEEIRTKGIDFKWVAGALDGAFLHHGNASDADATMAVILKKIAIKNRRKDKIKFYKIISEDNIGGIIDSFLSYAAEINIPVTQALIAYIRFLIIESPDRGAVKMGIALAGAIKYKEVLSEILTLARHEEFTLYASVAVMSIEDDYEPILWKMAKEVHGWGRIHLVERLADTTNQDIKDWIFYEGYHNSILDEYLTTIAANTGNLDLRLQAEQVDQKTMLSSSEIIASMILEGPVTGISGYEHADSVIKNFVKHVQLLPKKLSYLITLDLILSYLKNIEMSELEIKRGWSDTIIDCMILKIKEIINDDEWPIIVKSNLNTSDNAVFWQVKKCAEILGIDIKDTHWKRLKSDSNNSSNWYNVIESYDIVDEELLNYARTFLPLEDLCTGAREELGLGMEYTRYTILMYILQALRGHDNLGKDFVLHALNSPVINNRNMALNVLASWESSRYDGQVMHALTESLTTETNADIVNRIKEMIVSFESV